MFVLLFLPCTSTTWGTQWRRISSRWVATMHIDPWGTPWRRITLPSACQLSEHSSWAPRIYRKKRALQGLTTLESTRCLKEAVYLLSSVRSKWFQAYDLFAIMQWRMFLPITHAANDVPTNYTCNEKFIVVLCLKSGPGPDDVTFGGCNRGPGLRWGTAQSWNQMHLWCGFWNGISRGA